MPIKCAGAPQKAMYLSADHWRRSGVLKNIDIEFYNAGGVLFGVKDYVPALMEYVKRYDADLNFIHNLIAIDGPAKKAWFNKTDADGKVETVETSFDMIHVCPPQTAPDFIRVTPLADAAGWVDVDQDTLRHKTYRQHLVAGRRDERAQRQDRRRGAQAGAGGGRQRAGRHGPGAAALRITTATAPAR